MRISGLLFTTLLLTASLAVQADPLIQTTQSQTVNDTQNTQNTQNPQNQTTQDVFSYSYLQINRLSEWSDYFNDRSAGNGLKFSYGFDGGVYLFGQWNRLNFKTLDGHHDVSGFGVGAHQQYNDSTSFFIDMEYLRDRLSGNLGGAEDNYWRVTYGFHTHLSDFVALTGAIFTERNTDFGRRPFGERLGLSFGSNMLALGFFGEHTANGNRVEAELNWYYR
ncbi:MAG TPA: hypothetical protein VNI53_09215 [Gammaproteobacteria bacterium]|nr:hypothetical protein [Gammaproteobacteria bacterium]